MWHERHATRVQILIYALILVPVAVSPTLLGVANWGYFWSALILSLVLVALSLQLYFRDDDGKARQLFALSIAYLFLIFGLLLVFGDRGLELTWNWYDRFGYQNLLCQPPAGQHPLCWRCWPLSR